MGYTNVDHFQENPRRLQYAKVGDEINLIVLKLETLLQVGKKNIDPSIVYTVALTGHLLRGGDGYKCKLDSKAQVLL